MAHENGFVGLFDILGYQSFLENNEPNEAMEEVLQALRSMPAAAVDSIAGTFTDTEFQKAVAVAKQIRHLIFSDTVLLTLGLPEKHDKATRNGYLLVFLLQTIILSRKMFDFGLPLRGAITFGDYSVQDHCFVGKPIVEAYRTASRVDAAAVVLGDSCLNNANEAFGKYSSIGLMLGEYLMPMKGGAPERKKVVNIAAFPVDGLRLQGDERALVAECFWKHGKDIPPTAFQKLTNTEMLLRFFNRMVREHQRGNSKA
jgi:hypothetical protein